MGIDIAAIRLIIPDGGIHIQLAEQGRCCSRGCTVGTIHCNTQTGQVTRNGFCQIIGIFLYRIHLQRQDTANLIMSRPGQVIHTVNIFLNPCFQLIRQLVTAVRKNLDAIVLIGIMRCGNHNTCICHMLNGQMCNSRSRNHTQRFYIRTGGADACGQCRLQHIRRNAGILTDQNLGAMI